MDYEGIVEEDGVLRLPQKQRRRWGLRSGSGFRMRETPRGLLLTPKDPPLAKVYVEPTTACNLSCSICIRNSWNEPTGYMDMRTYGRLIDGLRAVHSLSSMAFWGIGEPLLHPQIPEMISLAKSLGAQTELITNGLLLDKDMSEALVRAGLDKLVVSVDGTSPETYSSVRSGADLSALQDNVRGLHRAARHVGGRGPEVGLEFVVTRRNVAELGQLRRLARSMGASLVVVTNLLPCAEGSKEDIIYWLSTFPRRRSRWNPEIVLPPFDARSEYLQPLLELLRSGGTVSFLRKGLDEADGYCRFVGEGAAAVAWNGGVSPCIALMHSYQCYVLGRPKTIRCYTLGNVGQRDIEDIWTGDEYARFRQRVLQFDFPPCVGCGGCEWVESNEEDCFLNPFPVCGDCLWARGIIQCP